MALTISQPSLFKFLLVGLPIGLAVTVVIALGLYYTEPERNQPSYEDAQRFASPVAEADLKNSVIRLSETVGPRSVAAEPDGLTRARKFIQSSMGPDNMGYTVALHPRKIGDVECPSVIAELPGRGLANEVIVVAAPYSSAPSSPGAGRSGSGVAALLGIARAMVGSEQQRTLRFVAYASESADPATHDLAGAFRTGGDEVVTAILDFDTIAFPRRESNVWEADVPMIIYSRDEALAHDIVDRYARGIGLRLTTELVGIEEGRPPESALPLLTFVANTSASPAGTAGDVADSYDFARFTQAVKKLATLVDRLANPGGV